MIPTYFCEDWSRNKKVMATLLCSYMKFTNFRSFFQDSTIFPFDKISISIKFFSTLFKDDTVQVWWRLVHKQKSYGDFTEHYTKAFHKSIWAKVNQMVPGILRNQFTFSNLEMIIEPWVLCFSIAKIKPNKILKWSHTFTTIK